LLQRKVIEGVISKTKYKNIFKKYTIPQKVIDKSNKTYIKVNNNLFYTMLQIDKHHQDKTKSAIYPTQTMFPEESFSSK